MKKCKDCRYGNCKWDGSDENPDYCGKIRNSGGPCDYDHCLPKKNFNKDGDCKDFELPRKRWKFWK